MSKKEFFSGKIYDEIVGLLIFGDLVLLGGVGLILFFNL